MYGSPSFESIQTGIVKHICTYFQSLSRDFIEKIHKYIYIYIYRTLFKKRFSTSSDLNLFLWIPILREAVCLEHHVTKIVLVTVVLV